jgi:plastocyanin
LTSPKNNYTSTNNSFITLNKMLYMSQISKNTKLGLAGLAIVVIAVVGFFMWQNMGEDKDSTNNTDTMSSESSETSEPDMNNTPQPTTESPNEDGPVTGNEVQDNTENSPQPNTNSPNGEESNAEDTSQEVKQIELDGFNYGYSQEEITVEAGSTVQLTLTSSEGFHDWVVDEIPGAKTDRINAGEETQVEFQVPEDAQGEEYEFYCSVGNHREQGMVGTLMVE